MARRDRVLVDVLEGQTDRRISLKRQPSGDHLVEDAAQGVNIGLRHGGAGIHRLLRGDVLRRAEGASQRCLAEPIAQHCQSEVAQDRLAVGGDHNVARFHVAVDDALFVRVIQGRSDLSQDVEDLLRGEGAVFAHAAVDFFPQVVPFDELHHQVMAALKRAKVVYLDDVGVTQGGDGLRFSLEAAVQLLITLQCPPQEFDRHHAAQCRVVAFVNFRHSTLADFRQNFVRPDSTTDEGF